MNEKETTLEAYKTLAKFAIYGARGRPPLWPFSIIETNWYYTKFFPKEIYHTIKALEEKGIGIEKIAELYWGPSAITHWFYIVEPTLGDLNLNPFEGLTKEEGVEFIEKTIEILSHQRKEDIFCRDMKNILLSDDEVKQILEGKRFIEAKDEPEIAKLLPDLIMTIWHYTILIQGGHRAYSQEFHGPYPLGENKSLLIKDFFNLKPGEYINELIWDFSSEIPYDKIRILEVYDNTEIQIDMFNHYNVAGNFVKFCVIAEDSSFSSEKIKDLAKVCDDVMSEGNRIIDKFSKPDWVKKIIDLRYLWLKPSKDILGEDWRPPERIYSLVNKVSEAERVAREFENNIISLIRGIPPEKAVEKVAEVLIEKIYNANMKGNEL